jgi:peptidoglycan hydrolase-like amidase
MASNFNSKLPKWQMLKTILVFTVLTFSIVAFLFLPLQTQADELDDIARQIAELEQAKQQSEAATQPLKMEAGNLETKLKSIQTGLYQISQNIIGLEKDIVRREKDFAYQYELLSIRVENFYKSLRMPSELLLLFSSDSVGQAAKEIGYQRAVSAQDKNIISKISLELSQLETDKQKVEKDKKIYEELKAKVGEQLIFFRKEIAGAQAYQKTLGERISELTAKQQELLAKKTGTFQTSVGDVPAADDPASRPDYNPGFSPAFAAFSFGAPHFKGMSQYGAFGRAKEGQNYEQILKAYYGNVRIETVDTNFDLPTTVGNLPFEDNYLKGIAEMPASWADKGGFEALKAQAIAARSYALAYVDWRMGDRSTKKSICTTENCQVYNAGKAGNPGRWGDAVNETKGKILVSNSSNEVVNTWYASTSGGYQESYSSLGHSTPGFWDTKSGRSGWTSQAFEKIGDSPWFYKGWYKTRSGTACSRSHPWLNNEEFSDIINALIVYIADESTQSHLSQEDSGCFGEVIPDTWSKNQLRNEASSRGGAVTSISSVSVIYSESGVTSQITVGTNRGSLSFDGQKFYKIFNLRAPGAIHLKSGLFNIEKK